MQNRNYTYYNQGEMPWKTEKYANSNSTIGQKGCAMSCIGMIINKNPSEMNKYLLNNNGFDGGNNVKWDAVKTGISYKGTITAGSIKCKNLLYPEYFDQGCHVILKLKSSHFVLMTGHYGNTINVLDPGHRNTTTYNFSDIDSGRAYQ